MALKVVEFLPVQLCMLKLTAASNILLINEYLYTGTND